MSLGANVRALRLERGLSQADLAGRAGVRENTIRRIESGESKRPQCLLDVARALGVSAEDLVSPDRGAAIPRATSSRADRRTTGS